MAVQTMQVTTGKHQNLRVQIEDLDTLKRLKRDDEISLAVTFHRIVEAAEMYDAILKAGEAKS
jgi:hypothetical protein